MPIIPHPACTEPTPGSAVCRYLDLIKFRDLFYSEELYLRRLDLFKESDPREGIASDEYIRKINGLRAYVLEDELRLNDDHAFARQNSEGYFISCWHLFEGETMKMWSTYGNCACIFSRAELLRSAVDAFLDPISFGIVRYSERGKTGDNLIDAAFRKRIQFQSDRELRVLLQCYDPLAGIDRHLDVSNFPHREPLDRVNKPRPWLAECKRRRIDLKSLVTEVRLAPGIAEDIAQEISLWVRNKNFACVVKSSDLESSLTPTPEEIARYT